MPTQKEKMLSGAPYRADDPALQAEMYHAKDLLFELAKLPPSQKTARMEGLRKLLGKTAGSFHIEFPFHCDYGYNISLGSNFYANHNLTILDCAPVHIGDNVLIGPSVGIYTAGHPLHAQRRNEGLEFALPIYIGHNVWIGGQAVINPGVHIGDNTVIGSGSVVTKDIPANSIAVGNPCRVIRAVNETDRAQYLNGYPAKLKI